MNTVKAEKSIKPIVRIVHLHQWFNLNLMKRRKHFLRKANKTLFNSSSPLIQRSAILENICWTQAAYALLCQPRHKDTSSMFVNALIWMKTEHPVCIIHYTPYRKPVCFVTLSDKHHLLFFISKMYSLMGTAGWSPTMVNISGFTILVMGTFGQVAAIGIFSAYIC